MNLRSLINRDDKMERAFEELQADMAEAFDESLVDLEGQSPSGNDSVSETNFKPDAVDPRSGEEGPAVELPEVADAVADGPDTALRLTSYTQSRLATLNSYSEIYHAAQEHLQQITAKLSEVTTSNQLTHQFLNILHADIHRANELELANLGLIAEQRKLTEQLQDAGRKHQEHENAVEAFRQREAGLVQDREALRAALSAARLELIEAANTIARNEAQLGDLVKTLSARTIEAERRLHENEALREKQVSVSIELDKALKREAETRRRLDEVSTIQSNEAARLTELLDAHSKSEKEVLRLQKSLEGAQTKQSEMMEAASVVEADREAAVAQNLAETRGLRSEIESLQSRLELAANEHDEAVHEIAKLKAQLSDAVAEKQVVDERLAALMKENEDDKKNLSVASANLSQLSLQHASEQIQLDIRKQECEDLRAEIASLNDQIKELLPYERLYRVTKARQNDDGRAAAGVNGMVDKARAASGRATGTSRRRGVTPVPANGR